VDEKDCDPSTYTVEIRAKTRLRPQGKSAMKTMAYLRVSKDSQDVKNQRLAILEFARQERREIGEFMEVQSWHWFHSVLYANERYFWRLGL
jgi:hypothetical protein